MRGRGCALMLAMLLPAMAWAQNPNDYTAPSGQVVTLTEILLDDQPGEPWLRFRFLAPAIARKGGSVGVDAAAQDMATLCQNIAAPYVAEQGLAPERIVISLSDRDVPFGQADPDATQFFELFRLQDGLCIWEEF